MKPIIVIKTGGKVAVEGEELLQLIKEIRELSDLYSFILIHGGGAEVTEASKIYGYEATFVDGVRMTSLGEMGIVDAILSGKINKRLVRLFQSNGVMSIGLSGNDGMIFTGKTKDGSNDNRTGEVTETNPALLKLVLEGGFTPIISSVSMEKNGAPLNINADEAALAISESLVAEKLIFVSDIEGILKDKKLIKNATADEIEEEIANGIISGGMIPKVRSSVNALKKGVKGVVISNYLKYGDLNRLINNKKGSIITLKKEIV